LFGRGEFSQVFRIGEVIESGAGPNRKNAARLKILTIEDEFVRYQSILSASKSRMKYSYLKLLLDDYEDLKPEPITTSRSPVILWNCRRDYTPASAFFSSKISLWKRAKKCASKLPMMR